MEAGNARSDSGDLQNRYINWTEAAARELSNHFTMETVDQLVHTQRYWVLRTAPASTTRLNALIDAELADREAKLDECEQELRRERERWRSKPATLTVVDTSIFFDPDRRIEEIDWLTITDSRPNVRLVVPLIVVYELDRLKRQGNNKELPSELGRRSAGWRPHCPG